MVFAIRGGQLHDQQVEWRRGGLQLMRECRSSWLPGCRVKGRAKGPANDSLNLSRLHRGHTEGQRGRARLHGDAVKHPKIMRSLTDVSHSFSHLHNNESRSRFLTGKKGESEVIEGWQPLPQRRIMGCGRCRNNQKNPEKHSYKYLMTLKIIAAADLTTQLEVLLQRHRGKAWRTQM